MILTNTYLASLTKLLELSKTCPKVIDKILMIYSRNTKIQKMETEKILKIYLEYQKHMILSRFTIQY